MEWEAKTLTVDPYWDAFTRHHRLYKVITDWFSLQSEEISVGVSAQ